MTDSYPLQQVSTSGTVVKVPGGEVEPASVARQLLPIADAISSVFEESRGDFLETIEVALSITADGDVAFLKGGEAALKLTFARQVSPPRP
ncbi:MAG: hypothetical protein ACXWX6_01285 [Actinomycetota bacterium]